MKVYFATMTGNAESLASSMVKKFKASGLDASLIDLAEVRPSSLMTSELAVFIVSTWGEGEPPDDADDFWAELEFADLELGHMRYSVFGLGDSGYTEFNGFARNLDERFKKLGARAVIDRVDADVDYDADFEEWEAQVFQLLEREEAEQNICSE